MSRSDDSSGETGADGESDTPKFEGQMIFKGDFDSEDTSRDE